MSAELQQWWAIFFTVLVIILTVAGVTLAIYMRVANYISKRRMWREIEKETDK